MNKKTTKIISLVIAAVMLVLPVISVVASFYSK